MALITGRVVFSSGATIYASDQNTNDGTIWNDYNGNITNANISGSAAIAYSKLNLATSIVNADINASAAIVDTKLAQITTASKVHGSSITGLASLPSGAGIVPIANLGTGSPSSSNFLRGDGSFAVPQSLSNVVYCWTGMVNSDANASAYVGTSLTAPTTKNYLYLWSTGGQTYKELLASKFLKISGISTLTVYCQIWQANSNTVTCKVDVGGQSGTVDGTASQTTPEWKNFTIDVSSLSNGTAYDLSVQIKQDNSNGQYLLLGAIIIFGS